MIDIDEAEAFAAELRAQRPELAHADLVVLRIPCIGGTWSLAASYPRDAAPKWLYPARKEPKCKPDKQSNAAARYHMRLGNTLKDAVIVHLGSDGKFSGGLLTRCPELGDR